MDIDPREVLDKSEYQGQDYYLCWIGCKEKFDANPERCVNKTPDNQGG